VSTLFGSILVSSPSQSIASNKGIDMSHIQGMEHQWHPSSATAKLGSVVSNQLIRCVNPKHPMIVDINDL
jgi:hypothetical protein